MSMHWTPQQTAAIDTRNRSIIVSAAAGSGKTAVLVERLVRILSDTEHKVRADNIIVVTFTNDAAAQMKQRLNAALGEQLRSSTGETYDWLLSQRTLLASARISTIHAFCFDLIRENADSKGLSPLFTIAEPAQEALCRRRAMQQLLAHWAAAHTEEMEILYRYLCTRDDSELAEILTDITAYLESLAFPEQWLRRAEALCKDTEALPQRMLRAFMEGMQDVMALAEYAQKTAADVMTADSSENRFTEKVSADIAAMQVQLAHLRKASVQEIAAEPERYAPEFVKYPSRLRKNVDATQKLICSQLCELYEKRHQALTEQYLSPLRYLYEDAAVGERVIPLLTAMTREYLDLLREEKIRTNQLGFSDAEQIALELLGEVDDDGMLHRTPLAKELSEQYDLIMVDEYQDSNNKQDCLFKLLSKEPDTTNGLHYGRNVFLVGDVKQSIYSFRRANPENFRRVLAESKPLAESQDGDMAHIYLNQNFRSAPGVLDLVNALCGCLMSDACGEVVYNEDEMLYFGASAYAGTDALRTQVILPVSTETLPEDADLQAECMAQTIRRMLDEKTPVILHDGSTRPCQPEDFCILLRSVRKYGGAVAEALRNRGIPVSADEESGMLAMPEIGLIRSILRVLDNPMTDTALAALLLSPVCGFTPGELGQLKTYGKRRRLYLQLCTVAGSRQLPETLRPLQSRCEMVCTLLGELRDAAERLPLEDCIREVYQLTDLLSLQSLYEDAPQRRERLNTFAQLAQGYRENAELSSQSCLSGWLRYLDHLEESGRELEYKPADGGNGCVRIKTIHRSKGLEYPFVLLAHMEQSFSHKPGLSRFQADENGLIGLQILDGETLQKSRTVAMEYLLADVYRRQRSEEMRLLYVALTRARQQLLLVTDGLQPKKSITSASRLGELLRQYPAVGRLLAPYAKNMQDWLVYFLFSTNEAEHLARAIQGTGSTSALADYVVTEVVPASKRETAVIPVTAHADADALARMREQLAFRYTSPQTVIAAKNSVTELSHPDTSVLLKSPAFTIEGKSGKVRRLRGAARGSAVHKLLQYMDFSAGAADPAGECSRLLQEGILTEAEAEAVTPQDLAAFFGSGLYQRIAVSPEVIKEKQFFVRISELRLPEDSALAQQYAGTDGILIGKADLLFREGDGWILVDYKTDHAADGGPLLEKYSMQLGLYRLAAELVLGEPVREAYLYSFALDCALPVALDEITY